MSIIYTGKLLYRKKSRRVCLVHQSMATGPFGRRPDRCGRTGRRLFFASVQRFCPENHICGHAGCRRRHYAGSGFREQASGTKAEIWHIILEIRRGSLFCQFMDRCAGYNTDRVWLRHGRCLRRQFYSSGYWRLVFFNPGMAVFGRLFFRLMKAYIGSSFSINKKVMAS